jgi:hypothetical protein
MIPFVIVKTAKGSAFIRPERVVAINATDPEECIILMTDGVTIVTKEPAEDIVARLEAEAREEDAASARGA